MKKHALVLGSTGATGREIVDLLIKNTNFSKITVFVRKKTSKKDSKITEHVIDFNNLEAYKELINGDILYSCLGTTKLDAGSKKKQFLVDYTYQYEFAKIAAMNGVENYSLVSSIGANKNSFLFYPKIKGMLEEEIKSLNFKNIQIYQPPSLIRQVDLARKGERLTIGILNFLNKFGLLTSLKPLQVRDLAKKMINESFKRKEIKIQVFKSRDLV